MSIEKNQYDLIITDMNYPEYKGGCDAFSGEKLAVELEKRNIDIPVIMVSSCQYEMPEFIASIRSSDEKDWKTELKNLIRKIDKDLQSKKEEFYER